MLQAPRIAIGTEEREIMRNFHLVAGTFLMAVSMFRVYLWVHFPPQKNQRFTDYAYLRSKYILLNLMATNQYHINNIICSYLLLRIHYTSTKTQTESKRSTRQNSTKERRLASRRLASRHSAPLYTVCLASYAVLTPRHFDSRRTSNQSPRKHRLPRPAHSNQSHSTA